MDKIPSHVAKLQSLTLASDMHASEGGIVGKDLKGIVGKALSESLLLKELKLISLNDHF
jgi:hypothetical protein